MCREIAIHKLCRLSVHERTIVSDSEGTERERKEERERERVGQDQKIEITQRAGEHTERSPKRKQDGGRRVGRAGGREGG